MRKFTVLLAGLFFSTACAKDPIQWVDRTEMPDRHPSPLAFPAVSPLDSTLRDSSATAAFARTGDLLREAGAQTMLMAVMNAMPEARQPAPAGTTVPPMSMAAAVGGDLGFDEFPVDWARCARSLRIVAAPGRGRVAVWWTRRSGGRVALVAAWQMQGLTDTQAAWRGPISIDTVDQGAGDANATERGAVGCNRPAAGVAVDSTFGYVHVVYALNAPEGPGIFYAHQMDPRSAFEPASVIEYGDRKLGVARVSTAGTIVAIAYEDPNAPLHRGRIALALSRNSGHVFEARVLASPLGKAVDPYVMIQGSAAVVGWSEVDSTISTTSAFRMRRGVVK